MYEIIEDSDAHKLEDISEAHNSFEAENGSIKTILDAIKGLKKVLYLK